MVKKMCVCVRRACQYMCVELGVCVCVSQNGCVSKCARVCVSVCVSCWPRQKYSLEAVIWQPPVASGQHTSLCLSVLLGPEAWLSSVYVYARCGYSYTHVHNNIFMLWWSMAFLWLLLFILAVYIYRRCCLIAAWSTFITQRKIDFIRKHS